MPSHSSSYCSSEDALQPLEYMTPRTFYSGLDRDTDEGSNFSASPAPPYRQNGVSPINSGDTKEDYISMPGVNANSSAIPSQALLKNLRSRSAKGTLGTSIVDGVTMATTVAHISGPLTQSTPIKATLVALGFCFGTYATWKAWTSFFMQRAASTNNYYPPLPKTNKWTIATIMIGFSISEVAQVVLAGWHLHNQKNQHGEPQITLSVFIASIIYKTLVALTKTKYSLVISPHSRPAKFFTTLTPFLAGSACLYAMAETLIIGLIAFSFCEKIHIPFFLNLPITLYTSLCRGNFEAKYTVPGLYSGILQTEKKTWRVPLLPTPHTLPLAEFREAQDILCEIFSLLHNKKKINLPQSQIGSWYWTCKTTSGKEIKTPTLLCIALGQAIAGAFEGAMGADIIQIGYTKITGSNSTHENNHKFELTLGLMGFLAEGILALRALKDISGNGSLFSFHQTPSRSWQERANYWFGLSSIKQRNHYSNRYIAIISAITLYPIATKYITYPYFIEYSNIKTAPWLLTLSTSVFLPLQLLAINKILHYLIYCIRSLRNKNLSYEVSKPILPSTEDNQTINLSHIINNHLGGICIILALGTFIWCYLPDITSTPSINNNSSNLPNSNATFGLDIPTLLGSLSTSNLWTHPETPLPHLNQSLSNQSAMPETSITTAP